MPGSDRPSAPPAASAPIGLRLLILAVLLPAIVVPLLVGLYDRSTPELFGFPFFFWFQLAFIPVAAGLTVVAYYLAKAADHRRREIDRERRRDARRPEGR